MVQRRFYVRPISTLGAVYSEGHGDKSPPFAKLCGRKDLTFAHVEIIDKQDPLRRAAQILHFEDLKTFRPPTGGWFSEEYEDFQSQVDNLMAPRSDFAGLCMSSPKIMGIVNLTPDSFSDGGSFSGPQAAIDLALQLVEEGADILDLGAESTRPGAKAISVAEELKRLMPVLEGLRPRTKVKISIDTRKADVITRTLEAGADIWNDVSALTFNPCSLELAADKKIPVILMHAQGLPETMNENPQYQNVTLDVFDYLRTRIDACVGAGIDGSNLVVDPGIGFGKHLEHNIALLSSLSLFQGLGAPVLLGVSRKKLIGQLSKQEQPKERVSGSLAAALSGITQGIQFLRVHDVAETRQAVQVWQAIVQKPLKS